MTTPVTFSIDRIDFLSNGTPIVQTDIKVGADPEYIIVNVPVVLPTATNLTLTEIRPHALNEALKILKTILDARHLE